MYELSLINRYDTNEITRERFTINNINEINNEIESLRWKYRDSYLTMKEFIDVEIGKKKNTLQVEFWRKNEHNDFWKGAGDYFFLQNEDLEKEIKEIIKKHL